MNRLNRLARSIVLGAMFALVQITLCAHATDISDTPLAVRNLSQPNIMFMIDNSGSMSNIVPDSPYSASTTYLSSCPSGNLIDGGVATATTAATEIYDASIKTDGTVRILKRSSSYGSPTATITYGTGSGEKCFDPAKYYYARLHANSTSTSSSSSNCGTNTSCYYPNGYLAAVYTGHYLNWYFGASTAYTSAANFGTGAKRKSGTTSRLEVAKSTGVSVVDSLSNVRAGLATYNGDNGGSLLEVVANVDAAKKTALNSKINGLTASGSTPLAETLADIGRYFTLPLASNSNLTLWPGQSKQTTQTIDAIFNNHTILNSTGVTTLAAPIEYFCQKSFAVLLTDGRPQNDQAVSTHLADYDGDCSGTNASNCSTYDKKNSRSYESAGSDYLDDVAQALFDMDLRPDLLPSASSGLTKGKNNLITYTIAFADAQATNDPLLLDTATQGGGQRFTASDSAQLLSAFQSALVDIQAVDGAAAAVAVANANVTSGDNDSFASSYNSGTWYGDLEKFDINASTGAIVTPAIWSAQSLLDARTSANRYIATHNGSTGSSGAGIQFQPTTATTTTKLSTTQQNLLNTGTSTDGAAVLDYLRGARSGETAGTYRVRTHLLGDIVNAEPLVVRKPNRNYGDSGYSSFKTAQASRIDIVYQGANDGMLHAFRVDTGAEEWAYIPNLVMANLNNLSKKTGFLHRFYVDGTPAAGDVDFKNTDGATGSGQDWRTILVGGLNKGGRGYYALDITTPTLPATNQESTLASKVLWEFPNSITSASDRTTVTQNMGYSYTRPIIVKTAKGWVVLVASGYNNGTDTGGDGKGYLYVINAKTGDLIKAISTNVGSASDPSGLAKLSAYVENADGDNTVTYVYGGDLQGNVWRFDLTSNSVNSWDVKLIATLVDASGNFQPVTTEPELAKINIAGTDRYLVYVGTGLYLGDSDLSGISGITPNAHAAQTQTMYGLLDNYTNSPTITSLRSSLVQQTINGTTGAASSNAVDYTVKKGWYLDFPDTGERSVTDPQLALGALIFTTNTPTSTTCIPGGSSKLYFIDYITGGFLPGSTVSYSFVSLGSALSSRPVLIKLESGELDALIRQSDKDTLTENIPISGSSSGTRRINWREVINQ